MPRYDVTVMFIVEVEAEDPASAVDEFAKLHDSGEFAEGVKTGRFEPLAIERKHDVTEVLDD